MAKLTQEQIHAIHEAAINAGLAASRKALLPEGCAESLPVEERVDAQLLRDLNELNSIERLKDGTDPLAVWSRNAERLSAPRIESGIFARVPEWRGISGEQDLTPAPPPVNLNEVLPPATPLPSDSTPTPLVPNPMPTTSGKIMRYTAIVESPPAPPVALPPPPRARFHFVGRDNELQTLVLALISPAASGRRIAVVHGLGGVGKTALAMHFAEHHEKNFPGGVLWGDLGGGAEPRSVLLEWRAELGGGDGSDLDIKVLLGDVTSKIEARTKQLGTCLLVLDNVRKREALELFLNKLGSCAVLVTTREAELATDDRITLLPLGGLRTEDCREYLRHVTTGGRTICGRRPSIPSSSSSRGTPWP